MAQIHIPFPSCFPPYQPAPLQLFPRYLPGYPMKPPKLRVDSAQGMDLEAVKQLVHLLAGQARWLID